MFTRVLQVLSHDWVTDNGRLPAVQQFCEPGSEAQANAVQPSEQQALTALKRQVWHDAGPSLAERVYVLSMYGVGSHTHSLACMCVTAQCCDKCNPICVTEVLLVVHVY